MSSPVFRIAACALFTLSFPGVARAAAPTLERAHVFTDERAVVRMPEGAVGATASAIVSTITTLGRGPDVAAEYEIVDDRIHIEPLGEGIHVVRLRSPVTCELRFLALDPPAPMDEGAVIRNLPRAGVKLVTGRPFTILAMGDSVTATGEYETILGMLLERATGNRRIRVITRAYPGRSVDAAVRFYEDDALPNNPDLGLLMYGLNDQICFVPLDAYLEQYEFIATRLRDDCDADCVFLQPTPHIDIAYENGAEGNAPHFALRTIGFAESLRPLARRLGVPVADTFHALWGRGGPTLRASSRAMWPLYPRHYSKQFTSLLESDGTGDTIHPNVLGHLAIARAGLDAINGATHKPPLDVRASSEWTDDGVVSTVAVRNRTNLRRAGRIEVHPLLDGEVRRDGPVSYDLRPGETVSFRVTHVRVRTADDLRAHPANVYVAPGNPRIPFVDMHGATSRVYAAAAPFSLEARFLREKVRCVGNHTYARLMTGEGLRKRLVEIPHGSDVGRIPLSFELKHLQQRSHAVAELAYVRYGGALRGEAEVDGMMREWDGHVFSPVGEPCQARWVRGPEDNRTVLKDCYLRVSYKAGARAMYVGIRATGDVSRDRFTIFFDPREPGLLGSVGRYYWIGGSVQEKGRLKLGPGETSDRSIRMKGAWTATKSGAELEIMIPYEIFECDAWPPWRDLGLSLHWVHTGADGKRTNLMWSEDGHPWNPRWYGVVRLQDEADRDALPFMARIK